MTHKSAPEKSEQLVTRTTIVRGLTALGVKKGDIICVHSALSSLGFVPGGARTIIESLIEAVGGDGTIVMPTFSGDLSDPAEWKFPPVSADWIDKIRAEMPAYDPALTPSRGVGKVPELFRHWPGALRSPHPQSSFTALGKQAAAIVGSHPLDDRFGPKSPLAALEKHNAKIVMIGAPLDTVSVFYLTQFDVEPLIRVKKAAPMNVDGKRAWMPYTDITYPCDWFPDAVNALIEDGIAKTADIGGARTIVFDIPTALNKVRQWRKERGV